MRIRIEIDAKEGMTEAEACKLIEILEYIGYENIVINELSGEKAQ
jgi:hypothetical protein